MFSSNLLIPLISGFISFIFGLLTMTLSDRVPFFSKAKYKRQLKSQIPQLYMFQKYKYKNNEMLYEVKLEVKFDEEMKESANLLFKEIDLIQDSSSKYFVTFKSKSSTVAQIRYLIYERYGEIPFKSEREFTLEDNNSFTLVFSIKDKPKSIIIVFNKNTIIYNLDDIDGNIIYPKIKLS